MPTIEYWSAPWCAPCKTLKPKVIALAEAHGFEFREHDVDDPKETAVPVQNILGVPYIEVHLPGDPYPKIITQNMASILNIKKAMNL